MTQMTLIRTASWMSDELWLGPFSFHFDLKWPYPWLKISRRDGWPIDRRPDTLCRPYCPRSSMNYKWNDRGTEAGSWISITATKRCSFPDAKNGPETPTGRGSFVSTHHFGLWHSASSHNSSNDRVVTTAITYFQSHVCCTTLYALLSTLVISEVDTLSWSKNQLDLQRSILVDIWERYS